MKPSFRHRRFIWLLAAIVTAVAVAACGGSGGSASTGNKSVSDTPSNSKAAVVVRIPDPGNSGPLAVGKKDGSLAKALAAVDAKVQWVGSAGPFAPAAQEMDANELDIAQGSITSAVTALAQKPGFELFAQNLPDLYGEGILVKNGSSIKNIHDLIGKKVAVNQGGTGQYLLLKALANAGIPASKVQQVYLLPPETSPVFNSGQVQAWATWSTYSIAALANGAHFVERSGQFGSQNYSVWAVRSGFAKQHPQVLAALYHYLHTETLKEIANPTAFVNVFTSSGPEALTPAEIKVNKYVSSKGATVNPISSTDLKNFESVAKFFHTQKITPTLVNVAPYVVSPTS